MELDKIEDLQKKNPTNTRTNFYLIFFNNEILDFYVLVHYHQLFSSINQITGGEGEEIYPLGSPLILNKID